jgi:hypothetical protein
MRTVDSAPAIAEEWEVCGIVDDFRGSGVCRVLDIFLVKVAHCNVKDEVGVLAYGIVRPLKALHQIPLAAPMDKPIDEYRCLLRSSDVPAVAKTSVCRKFPAK